MLRHIEKHRKKCKNPQAVPRFDDSDSDSEGSQISCVDGSSGSDSENENQEKHKLPRRIPQSLLEVLDNPLATLERPEAGGSETDKSSEHDIKAAKSEPKCIICPGKKLKTEALIAEHLKSQAHRRRLERYRNFIEDPPAHTMLSPDPFDVIELLDAMIGPPPLVEPGTNAKKQKRRKRKDRGENVKSGGSEAQASLLKNPEKISGTKPSCALEKDTTMSGQTDKPTKKLKVNKRPRIRKGKRERKEKLEANKEPHSQAPN